MEDPCDSDPIRERFFVVCKQGEDVRFTATRHGSCLAASASRSTLGMTPSDKANRQFWAERRASVPKAPLKLSVADFVTEANKHLSADRAFVAGTRFVVADAADGGAPIASWEGSEAMRPLIQRIYQQLARSFELPVPFRIDRV